MVLDMVNDGQNNNINSSSSGVSPPPPSSSSRKQVVVGSTTADTVSRSGSDESGLAAAATAAAPPSLCSSPPDAFFTGLAQLTRLDLMAPPIALRPSADSVRHSVASVCGGDTDSEHYEEVEDVVLEPAQFRLKETETAADISCGAQAFSSLSDPKRIAAISVAKVEGWRGFVAEGDVIVKQIMAGLSNQLFQVSIRRSVANRQRFHHTDVLFRIYGRDVSALYDSAREVEISKRLSALGIAPKVLGTFEGGRLEEWISGSTLLAAHMGKRGVMDGVARILARLHRIDCAELGNDFPGGAEALLRWEARAFQILEACRGSEHYAALLRLNLPRLREDREALLKLPWPVPDHPLLREGFCHCDVQPNNFLVTSTSMRLIDFEYAGRNSAAYDIASYFWEMTCDYCVETAPFYAIKDELYPSELRRRFFLAIYLSERLGTPVRTTDRLVTDGLYIVERFQLLNHLVWTYWSVIRSPQAPTAEEFDMLGYARRRLDVYWRLREKLSGVREFNVARGGGKE